MAAFAPFAANAQTPSLVTQKDVPACRTIEDGKLFAQAIEMKQLDTFRNLLDSDRCTIWEKGTTIYLDQTVDGCGLTRIRGICEAVYAFTDKSNPQVYIAPLDETWTRRQLPASSIQTLHVMLAKLHEPADMADPVVPLPRRRPAAKAKERWFGQALADKLTKIFRSAAPSATGRQRTSYAMPE